MENLLLELNKLDKDISLKVQYLGEYTKLYTIEVQLKGRIILTISDKSLTKAIKAFYDPLNVRRLALAIVNNKSIKTLWKEATEAEPTLTLILKDSGYYKIRILRSTVESDVYFDINLDELPGLARVLEQSIEEDKLSHIINTFGKPEITLGDRSKPTGWKNSGTQEEMLTEAIDFIDH